MLAYFFNQEFLKVWKMSENCSDFYQISSFTVLGLF